MASEVIERFERMGVKARVEKPLAWNERFSIDVQQGRYVIRKPDGVTVEVLDVRPKLRHLLLMTRPDKARFLCGHDETHWFVAAIPESAPVSTVTDAMQALKPEEVVAAELRLRLKGSRYRKLLERRNDVRIRQGEWFFIAETGFRVPSGVEILYNEPIARMANGRFIGRPHRVEQLVRFGGETIWIPEFRPSRAFTRHREQIEKDVGTGVVSAQKPFLEEKWMGLNVEVHQWQSRIRNALVYARGRVTHPDHKTIRLKVWHKVVQNTEVRARAMANVAFID